MATSSVSIARLLSASVSLSRLAENRIRTVLRIGGDMGVVNKAEGQDGTDELDGFDPQTKADRDAQNTIIPALRKLFPGVDIVGEEGELTPPSSPRAAEADACARAPIVSDTDVPRRLRSVSPRRVTVWVDPLDGTKEFTAGRHDAVTTLVGIAVDGVPVAGVVHRPLADGEPAARTAYGVMGDELMDEMGLPNGGDDADRMPGLLVGVAAGESAPGGAGDRPFSIVTTRSHPTPELVSLVEKLSPEGGETRIGGAGSKVIAVIRGEADAYFYPQTGTKRWDTCAPEALLRIAGGHLVCANTGERYTYGRDVASEEPGTPGVMNAGGVLAAMNMDHIKRMLEVTCADDILRDAEGRSIDAQWLTDHCPSLGTVTDIRADVSSIVRGRHSHTVRAVVTHGGDSGMQSGTQSVFVKRCDTRQLVPRRRGPEKWRRDAASYRNEAAFLRAVPEVNLTDAPAVFAVSVREDADGQNGGSGADEDGRPDVSYVTVMAEVPGYQVYFMDKDHVRAATEALARQHAVLRTDRVKAGEYSPEATRDIESLWNPGTYWHPARRPDAAVERASIPDRWARFHAALSLTPEYKAHIACGTDGDSNPWHTGTGSDWASFGDDLCSHADAIDAALESRRSDGTDTVVHGDCKAANFIFQKRKGDGDDAAEVVVAIPIDYQWSGRFHPSADAAYLLSSSAETSLLRREPLRDLLAMWCEDSSSSPGGTGNAGESDNDANDSETLQRWTDAVEESLLHHALVVVPYMWGTTDPEGIRAQGKVIGRCAYNRDVAHTVAVAGWMVAAMARFKARQGERKE